jgi:hypothetical protein
MVFKWRVFEGRPVKFPIKLCRAINMNNICVRLILFVFRSPRIPAYLIGALHAARIY